MDIKGSGVHTETETNWHGLIQAVQTYAAWQISAFEDSNQHSKRTVGQFWPRNKRKELFFIRAVPVSSIASVSGMCCFYSSNYSNKGLILHLLHFSCTTDQQANPKGHKGLLQETSTNHLEIWDIMSVSQLVMGGGVSCLGHVWHVLMGQFKRSSVIHSYCLQE